MLLFLVSSARAYMFPFPRIVFATRNKLSFVYAYTIYEYLVGSVDDLVTQSKMNIL